MTEGVAPILPSRSLVETAIGLHFFHCPSLVEDAAALHAEVSSVGLPADRIPCLSGPPEEKPYGLLEFALVDEDGNLLRIGSPPARPAGPDPR